MTSAANSCDPTSRAEWRLVTTAVLYSFQEQPYPAKCIFLQLKIHDFPLKRNISISARRATHTPEKTTNGWSGRSSIISRALQPSGWRFSGVRFPLSSALQSVCAPLKSRVTTGPHRFGVFLFGAVSKCLALKSSETSRIC